MAESAVVTDKNPFTQSHLLGAERLLLFTRSAEALAEQLEGDFSRRLGECAVRCESVSQSTIIDLCDRPCDITLIGSAYDASYGVIITDLELALSMVEILCGGAGDAEHEERPLSTVETTLIDLMLAPVISHVTELFELQSVELGIHTSNPTALPDAPPEPTIAIALQFTIGTVEGQMIVGLTSSQIQVYSEKVDRRVAGLHATKSSQPNADIIRAVQPVPVDLVVGFNLVRSSAGQLAELEVGDVLRTGQLVNHSLVARVGSERLFTVRPAQRGQRLVAELTGRIDERKGER